MPVESVNSLVNTLEAGGFLDAVQVKELAALRARFADPKALAKELVKQGWLTIFQVNLLFQGKEKELFLGSYLLLDRLGEGGMGTVYKARHRNLDRIDALKVIRKDHLANAQSVQRFKQEAKAAAKVFHPNMKLKSPTLFT